MEGKKNFIIIDNVFAKTFYVHRNICKQYGIHIFTLCFIHVYCPESDTEIHENKAFSFKVIVIMSENVTECNVMSHKKQEK